MAGGPGVCSSGNFFEMNMRRDAIWCILRHNFEKCYGVCTVSWCVLTSSRLDNFSNIVTSGAYRNDNNIFWGGSWLFLGGGGVKLVPLKYPR